ncbi:MAG: hypothetical protein WKF97_04565 [Chitinophagaceae bacterium]
MDTSKKWIITTSGDSSVSDVEKSLTATGFNVEQVLDQIGCITGSATDDVAERLRTIPGIADVSPDTSIDIGRPDDPITW